MQARNFIDPLSRLEGQCGLHSDALRGCFPTESEASPTDDAIRGETVEAVIA